ncbi:transposase IS982 family protein [Shewanella baltica OS117]|uniref:Transposase, IS4 family n=1 Tax=Shewanella baltica (strain OS155 / ATCC BAA-1091) TaxID=325240 RepID=A3DA45_SHEB5|nr:transposase, IS4 family [Shewanella baltica OS155]AEH15952.1 transposase IS982 family protein [Shewanella baltica OS117]
MHKLVKVFCDIDDFLRCFHSRMGKNAVNRWYTQASTRWQYDDERSDAHIILFQMSHHRDFKNCYIGYLAHFYKSAFPNLLSYTRFLEVMPTALVPLCSYFANLKSDPTGIEFVDSTSIKVCHNLRINHHKTLACRGKGTMGWFYSFKLHLIVNHQGGIVAAKVTPANIHDTKPVNEMVHSDMNKLYADKGYISKALSSELLEKGVKLVTNVRKNMKKKVMSLWGRAMLSRRFIIETINDQLKHISQIEHSRHRSVHGFMLNMIAGLIAYQLKDNKPQLNLTNAEFNAIAVMAC